MIDESLGISLHRGLVMLGCKNVWPLRDFFPQPRTPDQLWVPEMSRKGYFILTRDTSLWDKMPMQRMMLEANAGAFLFNLNNIQCWEYSQAVIRRWWWMEKMALEQQCPFLYVITPRGHSERLIPGQSRIRSKPRRHRETKPKE